MRFFAFKMVSNDRSKSMNQEVNRRSMSGVL